MVGRETFAELRAAEQRLEELKGALGRIGLQIEGLIAIGDEQENARRASLSDEARGLISGGAAPAVPGGLDAALSRARHEQRVHAEAIRLQAETIKRLEAAAIAAIRPGLQKTFSGLVEKRVRLLQELISLNDAETNLRDGIERAGFSATAVLGSPTLFRPVGTTADQIHSDSGRYLAEVRERGLI